MKIISFNVNGLRARLHQLQVVIDKHSPAIIGLQETKVHNEEFPLKAINDMGYNVIYHGQKGHYGVALLTNLPVKSSQEGFSWDDDDAQKRLVTAACELPNGETLHVVNGYFPQGEGVDHPTKFPAKRQFYTDLNRLLTENYSPADKLLVMGDMNISPQDYDIGIGEDNRKRWLRTGKASFQPEEREWYQRLLGWGLTDVYRHYYPTSTDLYSWFDYRSKGFDREPKRGLRIDHLLATAPLLAMCTDSSVDYEIRAMNKPSDHAPIWVSISE
jgi:exodeoxyribonuclease-3